MRIMDEIFIDKILQFYQKHKALSWSILMILLSMLAFENGKNFGEFLYVLLN